MHRLAPSRRARRRSPSPAPPPPSRASSSSPPATATPPSPTSRRTGSSTASALGGTTRAVAAAPDGTRAYVAAGARIVAVDLARQAAGGRGHAGRRRPRPRRLGRRRAPVRRAARRARHPRRRHARSRPAGQSAAQLARRARRGRPGRHPRARRARPPPGRARRPRRLPPAQAHQGLAGPADVAFANRSERLDHHAERSRLVRVRARDGRVDPQAVDRQGHRRRHWPSAGGGTRAFVGALRGREGRARRRPAARGRTLARSAAGRGPGHPALSPDGLRVYVANGRRADASPCSPRARASACAPSACRAAPGRSTPSSSPASR